MVVYIQTSTAVLDPMQTVSLYDTQCDVFNTFCVPRTYKIPVVAV
jgi:hypothetical protein